jgi:hypothetical protein
MAFLVLWIVWTASPARLDAQAVPRDVQERFARVLKGMEVKKTESPPAWARVKATPLFRFAQITDIHLTRKREPLLRTALRFIDHEVKPTFVAITGDNAGHGSVERQKRLKSILHGELKAPHYIVRGDNWARNFSTVFGSTRYAFECGGIRFVFTGLDRDEEGRGIGGFSEDTWEWMRRELSPELPVSVILVMHENIQPPLFVHAGKLDGLAERSTAVAATLTGHLHFDLEFKAGRVTHVLAPALGPHENHPFKVYDVYEDLVGVRTVEWTGKEFAWVEKYQRIDLPHRARPPSDPPIEAYRELPARETTFDMRMKDHTGSLMFQMALFGRRVGMLEKFLKLLGGEKEDEGKKKEEGKEEEF